MKQFRKGILSIVCTLALLYSPGDSSPGCRHHVYLRVRPVSVRLQRCARGGHAVCGHPGPGGGRQRRCLAVASVQVTQGATQYIAADPVRQRSNAYAELIASDPDSGIAVFRLDGQITSRRAPTIQTLDGLSAGTPWRWPVSPRRMTRSTIFPEARTSRASVPEWVLLPGTPGWQQSPQ